MSKVFNRHLINICKTDKDHIKSLKEYSNILNNLIKTIKNRRTHLGFYDITFFSKKGQPSFDFNLIADVIHDRMTLHSTIYHYLKGDKDGEAIKYTVDELYDNIKEYRFQISKFNKIKYMIVNGNEIDSKKYLDLLVYTHKKLESLIVLLEDAELKESGVKSDINSLIEVKTLAKLRILVKYENALFESFFNGTIMKLYEDLKEMGGLNEDI